MATAEGLGFEPVCDGADGCFLSKLTVKSRVEGVGVEGSDGAGAVTRRALERRG